MMTKLGKWFPFTAILVIAIVVTAMTIIVSTIDVSAIAETAIVVNKIVESSSRNMFTIALKAVNDQPAMATRLRAVSPLIQASKKCEGEEQRRQRNKQGQEHGLQNAAA